MKRHNIFTTLLLSTFFLTSCQEKGYVEPEFVTKNFNVYASVFNHSEGGANLNPTLLTSNTVVGFKDLSNGELTHEWSFWSGDEQMTEWTSIAKQQGVDFIKENSNLGWGAIDDYTPFLDPTIHPTNSLSDITFIFSKAGAYKLKIRNTYDRNIRYQYSMNDPLNPSQTLNMYKDATAIGNGEYEMVMEYEFEIYDQLVPDCKVYTDEAYTQAVALDQIIVMDGVEMAEVFIEAGETLYFEDATGVDEQGNSSRFTAPDTRTWTWKCLQSDSEYVGPIPMVSPISSEAQQQAFTFETAGTYTCTMNVKREKPAEYGNKFPEANVTQKLPVIVYVL